MHPPSTVPHARQDLFPPSRCFRFLIAACILTNIAHVSNGLPAGTFLWADNAGASGLDDGTIVQAAVSDSLGNVCLVGYFSGTTDFDPGPQIRNLTPFGDSSRSDIFVLLLDRFGDLVWVRQIGGRHDDLGLDVAMDRDRDVYITGSYIFQVDFDPGPGTALLGSDSIADRKAFVLKLTNAGDFSFVRDIGGEEGRSISVDRSENVYLTGYFIDPGDFEPSGAVRTLTPIGLGDLFAMKITIGGRIAWINQLGAPGQFNFGESIGVDDLGNAYVMSSFEGTLDFDPGLRTVPMTSFGSPDMFVAKFDLRGQLVWARQFGGKSADLLPTEMTVDPKGNCFTTGSLEGGADFDPGFGSFKLATPEGTIAGYMSQVNSSGRFVQARAFLPTGKGLPIHTATCIPTCVSTDTNGNIYLTGRFDAAFDFEPGAGEFILAPSDDLDAFAVKLNKKGKLLFAGQLGGDDAQFGEAITADPNENFAVTGGFLRQPMDADPGLDTFSVDPNGPGIQLFAVKLSGVAPRVKSLLRASPSPTNLNNVFFFVTLTQAVTGVDVTDFQLVANGVSGASITSVFGSGSSYGVLVNTGTGDGDIRVDFVDDDSVVNIDFDPVGDVGVGNGNKTGPTYVIDRTLPTVTMTSDAPDPTTMRRIRVTVSVPQAIFGLEKNDIVPGNAKVKNFSGYGALYTFDLVALAPGLVTADIPQGAAIDEAGNDTKAATQFTRMYQP